VRTEARRVIAGVSGSVRNLAALRVAVNEARRAGAVLLPVLAWSPVGGEMAYRRGPCPPLLRVWEQMAGERMRTAFDEAFGGDPAGLELHPLVVRAPPGPALVEIAARSTDLLVIGSGAHGRLARFTHGAVTRYCIAHAHCPVLAVPPPDMLRELRGHHHWAPEDLDVHGAPPGGERDGR
jgi:nucleotide-binding universal stress UspA family protein